MFIGTMCTDVTYPKVKVYNILSSDKYRNKLVQIVQSVKQEDGFAS
jgi:hypothetical protein